MIVGLYGVVPIPLKALLEPRVGPEYEFVVLDSREKLAAEKGRLDALISFDFTADFLPMPNLKLLQAPGIGLDRIDFDAVPKTTTVCVLRDHEDTMAEYVFGAMLYFALDLRNADASLRQGSWRYSSRADGLLHNQLKGRTVGIIGLGGIGRSVARIAKAFGMRVEAANRTPRSDEPNIDRHHALRNLDGMLPECHYLVLAVPLTEDTRSLLNAERFKLCRSDAVVINIARGGVIEEEALYLACRNRTIKGAAMDVWYQYPTPEQPYIAPSHFPFHELENVLMTPHYSSQTNEVIEARMETVVKNLKALRSGEPFEHAV